MTKFSELGLAEKITRALDAEGYDAPTPIQAKVIPAVLAGRDVIGVAQTGTGKTASFVLPILHRSTDGVAPMKKGCRALILTPTRELAGQIGDAIRKYGRHVKPGVATIVGGMRPGPQERAVAPGVDVIVATPGRLMDHMQTGAVNVSGADLIVLDEADQMLDLGFLPPIRTILSRCAPDKQILLLSATMPAAIRQLAGEFLKNPEEIAVAPESKPIERIAQKVVHMDHAEKKGALIEFIQEEKVERGIVFTRTKRGADRVKKWLEQAGIESGAIHGDKSQSQRDRTLREFKQGRLRILVATDVAARGIDIGGVSHVINYEIPETPEAYVHRIGRTARAGASGVALSLCCSDELLLLRDIEKLTKMEIPAFGKVPAAPTAKPAPKRRGRGGAQGQGQGQKQGGQGRQARGGGQGQGQKQGQGQGRGEKPGRRADGGAEGGRPRRAAGGAGNGGKPGRSAEGRGGKPGQGKPGAKAGQGKPNRTKRGGGEGLRRGGESDGLRRMLGAN